MIELCFFFTLPAVVAAVRQGCLPSYLPMVAVREWIFWLSFKVKIGTSILLTATKPDVFSFKSHCGKLWKNLAKKRYNIDQNITPKHLLIKENMRRTYRAFIFSGGSWGAMHKQRQFVWLFLFEILKLARWRNIFQIFKVCTVLIINWG